MDQRYYSRMNPFESSGRANGSFAHARTHPYSAQYGWNAAHQPQYESAESWHEMPSSHIPPRRTNPHVGYTPTTDDKFRQESHAWKRRHSQHRSRSEPNMSVRSRDRRDSNPAGERPARPTPPPPRTKQPGSYRSRKRSNSCQSPVRDDAPLRRTGWTRERRHSQPHGPRPKAEEQSLEEMQKVLHICESNFRRQEQELYKVKFDLAEQWKRAHALAEELAQERRRTESLQAHSLFLQQQNEQLRIRLKLASSQRQHRNGFEGAETNTEYPRSHGAHFDASFRTPHGAQRSESRQEQSGAASIAALAAYNNAWTTISPQDPAIPYPTETLNSSGLENASPHSEVPGPAAMKIAVQEFYLSGIGITIFEDFAAGHGVIARTLAAATAANVQKLLDQLKKERLRWHPDKLGARNLARGGVNEALRDNEVAKCVMLAVGELYTACVDRLNPAAR